MSGSPSATVGLGVADLTRVTLALFALATVTVAVALLVVRLGTMFVADAVSVSGMVVPDAVLETTCVTNVKFAVALRERLLPSVQVIVPVPPTAGVVQVQPAGAVIDWKVVLGGVVCVNVGAVAAAGPLLVTLWV